MPSSMHQHLSVMVGEIITANPGTILDVGIGFGKWGFLAREFLETHHDRVFPNEWQLKIDGVEIFKEYVEKLPWVKEVYNHVYVGNIVDLVDEIPSYDLIIAGDVIEHIGKRTAVDVLNKLLLKAKKKFLLSIPLGNWLGNKVVANNPYESHKSIWTANELINLHIRPAKTYAYKGIRGDVGVFVYEKADYIVISYYTKGTGYQKEAEGLIKSLENVGLAYDISGTGNMGNWQKNTHYKAKFILEQVIKHKKPVVFLDADARVLEYPQLFASLADYDFAYHPLDWFLQWRGKKGDRIEALSGTLWVNYNDRVIAFLKDWIEENNRSAEWEQKNMERALRRWEDKLKIYHLPVEYCAVVRHDGKLPPHIKRPVILHTQASRRLKGEVNGDK